MTTREPRTAGLSSFHAKYGSPTATAKGLSETRVLEVLRRRVGLTGGSRMLDLLFQGDGRRVVAEIQAAA